MPLGLFHSKKDRMLKEKSKSTFDLFNNSDKLQVPERKLLKKKSGSTLNLFATKSSKDSPQISTAPSPPDVIEGLTKAHKSKSKSLFQLNEVAKTKSKSTQNLMDNNNNSLTQFKEKVRRSTPLTPFRKISTGSSSSGCSDDGNGKKTKNKVDSTSRLRSSKKYALGGSSESMEGSREKRMADLIQLDNYIDYLKKSDDCSIVNISNRLCCAQVLRLVLVKQQRMLDNDLHHTSLHDRNKMINYRNNVNSNQVSNPVLLNRAQSPPLDNANLASTTDNAPPVNRNQWSADQSSSHANASETQCGDRLFTRKGSNRKFKRSPPGLSLDVQKNIARSNINSYHSDTSLPEDDEQDGNRKNLCKTWSSQSSASLASSTSDLSPSADHDFGDTSPSQHKHSNRPLSIAVFSNEVEIY